MHEVATMSRRGALAVAPLPAHVARQGRGPRQRTELLRRERLLRRLAQARDVPLVLVVAPVGYGKTTLLAQWTADDHRASRWLSSDDVPDGPGGVLAMVAAVLEDIEPTGRRRLAAHGRATQTSVADTLGRMERPFLLVLDDVHRLRSRAALATLAGLADVMPAGSQIALASREEPPLPVGRLRAEGKLVDLRMRDLAMTRREAVATLGLSGVDLPREESLLLMQRTEGWPAGLYLAALSFRAQPDVHHAVRRFGGDDRLVADYLRDTLVDRLDSEALEFLRSASVLDTLTAATCDAVMQRTGSGDLLRRLSRANALVAPLDSTDSAYRCHPMLALMLRAELGRSAPHREAALHRRASAWFAAEGDIDRAIEHGIAGGDLVRVGELLWTAAANHLLDGRRTEVRRWLDRCGRERTAAIPTLALTAATYHLVAGERDLVEHWTDAAEHGLDGAAAPSVRAGIMTMRAAVARDGLAASAADAARAYALTAQGSPWRALCCLLRGVADHLLGDPATARAQLEEGARRGAVGAPGVQAHCLAQLALLAIDRGDWDDGALFASRAVAQVERRQLGRDATSALVYAASALVRAHRDRVEDARGDLKRAEDLLALVEHPPWYVAETRVVLARAALRLGDVTQARALLADAERMLPRAADAVLLGTWMDELRSRLDAFALTALIGPSSLTTAELRVLSLLPTHLSFREIGRRLHVSANTVKTHAHAIYRKLDVCSRSGAVVRAHETGLLDAEPRRPTKEELV